MKHIPLLSACFLLFTLHASPQVPDGYYSSAVDLSYMELKEALYDIIKGHTEYPYTSSSTDVWDILKETDRDTNDSDNVILLYSGFSVNAAQEYNSGSGWSREHVWAKSRGDFGTSQGPGTDVHHLRPCDISVNSDRNNRWFDNCSEPYYDGDDFTGSYTSSTEWVWKPRDEVQGDVARMIFYMATRYEGENGEPDLEVIDYLPADNFTTEPIHAKLSALLQWHQEDPVDDFERNRNEVIYSYQNNRNPFIDHPEWVISIWGNQPAEINNITFAPEEPTSEDNVTVDAQITDSDGEISKALLLWGFSEQEINNEEIFSVKSDDLFTGEIPSQAAGTSVYFSVMAIDNENDTSRSDTVSYTVSASSYLKELDSSSRVSVFPNPSKGRVYISNPLNESLSLHALNGKMIAEIKNNVLDMSTYARGTYILVIGKNKGIIKLIKP